MLTCRVGLHRGNYCVDDTNGTPVAIAWPGGGALPLLPGWTPKYAYVDATMPVNILELHRDNGQQAIWFLNKDLVFITNDINMLPKEMRRTLDERIHQSLLSIWQAFVTSEIPRIDLGARWINDLGITARNLLIDKFKADLFPSSEILVLDDRDSIEKNLEIWKVLDPALTRKFLDTDLLEEYIAALKLGQLRLRSPVDGEEIRTDSSYILTKGVVAHRFYDARHRFHFYAISGLWKSEVFALYLPTLGRTIYKDKRALEYSNEFLRDTVHNAIARHVFEFSHLLEGYLGAPSRASIVKYHQDHLGHHLWNELSALERVVQETPREKLPEVHILSADHSEMYGPVDHIFPELLGRVMRTNADARSFVEQSYKLRKHLLLPGGQYVTRKLAKRIIDLSERADDALVSNEKYSELVKQGFRFVMLGLRVENRTIVDIEAFSAYLVEILSQRLGKVAVVIDGHNSVQGNAAKLYASHSEKMANMPPADVENRIVSQLRARFNNNHAIAILSSIGASMNVSIYWCNRCEFFITPWGAGLAKYRWICNRPGLVLASPTFMRNSGQRTVHLYDSDEFMERPTPLSFVCENVVRDEPSAKLLVGIPDANRMNFSVDREAFAIRLKEFMAKTLGLNDRGVSDGLREESFSPAI